MSDPRAELERLDDELAAAPADLEHLERLILRRQEMVHQAASLPASLQLLAHLEATLARTCHLIEQLQRAREEAREELTRLTQLHNLTRTLGSASVSVDCEL